MIIETSTLGDVHMIAVSGELDGGREQLSDALADILTGPRAKLVIDLSGVTYMNSAGLSELVSAAAKANVNESRLVLAGLTPFVEGVLQTTQLDRFFEVAPSVDDALRRMA